MLFVQTIQSPIAPRPPGPVNFLPEKLIWTPEGLMETMRLNKFEQRAICSPPLTDPVCLLCAKTQLVRKHRISSAPSPPVMCLLYTDPLCFVKLTPTNPLHIAPIVSHKSTFCQAPCENIFQRSLKSV